MSATLFTMAQAYKRPESVLVVVHTPAGQTLLLKRARPVFWQSVTGSLEWPDEPAAGGILNVHLKRAAARKKRR